MKRELITVERVNAAKASGVGEITVAADATITPSALDKAHEAKILITRLPKPPCPLRSGKHPVPGGVGQAAVSMPADAGAHPDAVTEIRNQVFAAMPEARAREAQVEALIRDAVAAADRALVGAETSPASATTSASETSVPADTPAAQTRVAGTVGAGNRAASKPPVTVRIPGPTPKPAGGRGGLVSSPGRAPRAVGPGRVAHAASPAAAITHLNGAIVVDAAQLPWADFSGTQEYVNIVDITSAPTPLPLGYMEWENASFAWTAEQDEVRLVLQGCLAVTLGDSELAVSAGSALYLPRGCQVVFSATSLVRCACITASGHRAPHDADLPQTKKI